MSATLDRTEFKSEGQRGVASFDYRFLNIFIPVKERREMECHVEGEVRLTRTLKTGERAAYLNTDEKNPRGK